MSIEKTRVIIIDENVEFSQTLKLALGNQGHYKVINTATNGIFGLKLILESRPEVIIADLVMPKLNGQDMLSMLSHVTDYKPIIILYSDVNNDKLVKDVMSSGLAHYFIKPFEMDVFISRLNNLLNMDINNKFSNESYLSPRHDLYIAETTILLRKMGIPPHISGYHYLRQAIVLVSEDFSKITTIMNSIYKPIAYQNNSTVARVERSMRHAIEVACDRCRVHVLEELFGNTLDRNKDKPSNREFIALFADKVLLNITSNSKSRY